MEQQQRLQRPIAAEDEAVVGCLSVLCGASALVARHKVELARLLTVREPQTRGLLERLAADLTEVLSGAAIASSGGIGVSSGQEQQQQQQGRADAVEGAMGPDPAEGKAPGRAGSGEVEASSVKRATGQQATQAGREGQQRQEQQRQRVGSSEAVARYAKAQALELAEVVEHVMSFVEGLEMLRRLNRVCRLWRRVSESERLCLPLVEQYMPSALLADQRGGRSLHERLGASARQCLLVLNVWLPSGRLICMDSGGWWWTTGAALQCMVEVFFGDRVLCAGRGSPHLVGQDDTGLKIMFQSTDVRDLVLERFTPASLQCADVHEIFTSEKLWGRVCIMDMTTGVTASIFQTQLSVTGDYPGLDEHGAVNYETELVQVTSLGYDGPPLQAQLQYMTAPLEEPTVDEWETLRADADRVWFLVGMWTLRFEGQSPIYGQKFIQARLEEEAKAIKQFSRR